MKKRNISETDLRLLRELRVVNSDEIAFWDGSNQLIVQNSVTKLCRIVNADGILLETKQVLLKD